MSASDCGPECQRALRQIERFLDGELDPAVRGEVERHLSACSPCMDRADFRRHLRDLVASKCRSEHVPADLRERVMGAIRDTGRIA